MSSLSVGASAQQATPARRRAITAGAELVFILFGGWLVGCLILAGQALKLNASLNKVLYASG